MVTIFTKIRMFMVAISEADVDLCVTKLNIMVSHVVLCYQQKQRVGILQMDKMHVEKIYCKGCLYM